jgi:hypothetical protein
MSFRQVAALCKDRDVTDVYEYCVLMTLAHLADDESGLCFPGTDYIVAQSRCSRRKVFYVLQCLEKKGWISIQPQFFLNGFRKSNLYCLLKYRDQECTPCTNGSAPGALSAVHAVHPDPIIRDPISNTPSPDPLAKGVPPSAGKVKKLEPASEFLEELRPLYPGLDVDSEFNRMRAWMLRHPKRKLSKRFMTEWLNRAADRSLNPDLSEMKAPERDLIEEQMLADPEFRQIEEKLIKQVGDNGLVYFPEAKRQWRLQHGYEAAPEPSESFVRRVIRTRKLNGASANG